MSCSGRLLLASPALLSRDLQGQPAGVKVLLSTFEPLVGLCRALRFSSSALLFLLFAHSSIITDILKGFPFWSSFFFSLIILELLSSLLSLLSPWFWKMLKQEMDRCGFKSNLPYIPHLPAPAPRRLRDLRVDLSLKAAFLRGSLVPLALHTQALFVPSKSLCFGGACNAQGNMAETDKVGDGVSAPPDSLWDQVCGQKLSF